jgi:hypothetical protein
VEFGPWISYLLQAETRFTSAARPLQAKERELLRACGSNPYQRALLLVQMASLQPDAARQAAVLEVGLAKRACRDAQARRCDHWPSSQQLPLASIHCL